MTSDFMQNHNFQCWKCDLWFNCSKLHSMASCEGSQQRYHTKNEGTYISFWESVQWNKRKTAIV